PAAWPYLAFSLAVHNGYYLFLIMAYRYGDLSHVYPIARGSAPLIVAVVSVVFLSEALTRQAFLAVVVIGLGVMSLALTRGASGFKEPRAVLFALGTGGFIAAYTILDGLGARLAGSPHGYTFWFLAIDTVPLALITLCVRRGEALRQVRRSWKAGLLGGMVALFSTWLVIWALTLAPLALVSALRETSIVFAVLFGVVFLKERLDLIRLAATTTTLVGAVMLKTSK
ncbi:MAG: DMT family transporter, partial [Acidiferrobacterales bacterium]